MIKQINQELPEIMHLKAKLIMAIKNLAASITGLTGIVFGFVSSYFEELSTLGSVITWFLSTALIIMTGYYYFINAKYKREQLKRIRKENKDKQKDDDDTTSDSTNK